MYELAAASDEERRRWLDALTICLAVNADGAAGPDTPRAPAPAPAAPLLGGSSLAAVTKEGLLEKRGAWNTAWKTRHFVLTDDGILRYFKPGAAAAAAPPLGAVPLRTGGVVIRAVGIECGRDVIEVRVTGRTYVLGAPSRRARDEWLDALLATAAV